MGLSSTGPAKAGEQTSPLTDRFGRQVNYLRISVTDRCDLRCIYCMSEDMQFVPRSQLLTLEEISRLGRNFVELGVKKIRVTGGEPLTRRNIMRVFEYFGQLDDEPLKRAIINSMTLKPKGHEFDLASQPVLLRHMNTTGG